MSSLMDPNVLLEQVVAVEKSLSATLRLVHALHEQLLTTSHGCFGTSTTATSAPHIPVLDTNSVMSAVSVSMPPLAWTDSLSGLRSSRRS